MNTHICVPPYIPPTTFFNNNKTGEGGCPTWKNGGRGGVWPPPVHPPPKIKNGIGLRRKRKSLILLYTVKLYYKYIVSRDELRAFGRFVGGFFFMGKGLLYRVDMPNTILIDQVLLKLWYNMQIWVTGRNGDMKIYTPISHWNFSF